MTTIEEAKAANKKRHETEAAVGGIIAWVVLGLCFVGGCMACYHVMTPTPPEWFAEEPTTITGVPTNIVSKCGAHYNWLSFSLGASECVYLTPTLCNDLDLPTGSLSYISGGHNQIMGLHQKLLRGQRVTVTGWQRPDRFLFTTIVWDEQEEATP